MLPNVCSRPFWNEPCCERNIFFFDKQSEKQHKHPRIPLERYHSTARGSFSFKEGMDGVQVTDVLNDEDPRIRNSFANAAQLG
jgi:hypothetical protein